MKFDILISTNLKVSRDLLFRSIDSISMQEGVEKCICLNLDCVLEGELGGLANELESRLVRQKVPHKIFNSRSKFGLGESLNFLVENTDGNYIVRHDDDDIAIPGRLKILELAIDICDFDLIATEFFYADNLGGQIFREGKLPVIDGPVAEMLCHGVPFAHPTICIKRESLSHLNVSYDPRFTYAQDYKLYTDLCLKGGRFAYLRRPTLKYHVKAQAPSKREEQLALHDLALFEFLRGFFYLSPKIAHSFRCKYVTDEFKKRELFSDEIAKKCAEKLSSIFGTSNNFQKLIYIG